MKLEMIQTNDLSLDKKYKKKKNKDNQDVIDMNKSYTGLEYDDIVFIDSAIIQSKTPFSEVSISSDEEMKFNLTFPLQ